MVVFDNLNSVRRKYHLVLLATWDFSKFGCLIFKSATAKDFRLQGSELFPPAKRKCDLFRQVAFSFGFRSRWPRYTSMIETLGRSAFALRQGFACGKTLYGAKAPLARRPVGCFSRKIANDLRGFGLLPLAIGVSFGVLRFFIANL